MNLSFFLRNKGKLTLCFISGLLAGFVINQIHQNFPLAHADSTVQLTMDSATNVVPGSSVDLNIYINSSGAPQQPAGVQFALNYNPADITSISWKADGQATKDAGDSASCASSSGRLFCLIAGLNNNTIANGTLGTVTVTLSISTSAVSIPLHFSDARWTTLDGKSDSMTATDVNLTVKQSQNNMPPTVAIVSPASGAAVSGSSATITATAAAQSGATIANVAFFIDGNTALGTANVTPYAVSWNTTAFANGSHILTAKATDSLGQIGTSNGVSITINNAVSNPLSCQPTSSTNININGSVSFSATGGQSPYALIASGASNISGLTATYNNSGSYSVSVNDNAGHSASCGTVTVSPNTPACTAPSSGNVIAPANVDPGQVFNVSCDFGVANAFIPTPGGCSSFTGFSGTAANFSCTAPGSGSIVIMCQIQNKVGYTNVCSTPTAVSNAINVSAPTTFTATASATATVSCPNGSTQTATAPATATSNVSQQDAQSKAQNQAQINAQNQAQSQCPAPVNLTCQPTSSTNINVNGSVSFQGSGGNGNYSLSAPGANVSGLTATYGNSGSFQVTLSDNAGHSASCGTVMVNVNNQVCMTPSSGIVTAPARVDSGQVFSVSCDFGVANAFIPTPAGCNSFTGFTGTAANFSCTAPNSGAEIIMCQVQNKSGYANVCSTPTAASNPIYVNANNPTTFTATVTQTATVSCPNGSTQTATASATATSNVSQADAQSKAQAQAQINAQNQAQSQCPAPVNLTCQPTSSININVNGSVSFSANGGQSPYTLVASGASNISGLTATYGNSGSFQVTLNDNAGHSASCGTVNVSQPNPTTFTAIVTQTATVNCPAGGTQTATASATATSNVSQADAQNKAQNQAQINAQNQAQSQCPAVAQTVSCSASQSSVNVNQAVIFMAIGGSGSYSWSGGENPASGSGASFSTSYSSSGGRSVTVTSGSQSASCSVYIIPQSTGGNLNPINNSFNNTTINTCVNNSCNNYNYSGTYNNLAPNIVNPTSFGNPLPSNLANNINNMVNQAIANAGVSGNFQVNFGYIPQGQWFPAR